MLKNWTRCVRGKRKTVKICWCTQWFVSAAVKTISHKCFNVTDFPFTKFSYWTHSHATILIFIYIVVVTAVAAATAVFVVVALPFCLKHFFKVRHNGCDFRVNLTNWFVRTVLNCISFRLLWHFSELRFFPFFYWVSDLVFLFLLLIYLTNVPHFFIYVKRFYFEKNYS